MSRRNGDALSANGEARGGAVKATVPPWPPQPAAALPASMGLEPAPANGPQKGPRKSKSALKAKRPGTAKGPSSPPAGRTTASPLYEGEPGVAKRVARGRLPISATLDLHGLTQIEAESRLKHFVEFASISGDRVLLIITGKGGAGSDTPAPFEAAPRGILRRRFLEWIETPPLRGKIASVKSAHQKHGGRGAFYVFLRKAG